MQIRDLLFDKLCKGELSKDEKSEHFHSKGVLLDIVIYKEEGAKLRSRVDQIEKGKKRKNIYITKARADNDNKTVKILIVDGKEIINEKTIVDELEISTKKRT